MQQNIIIFQLGEYYATVVLKSDNNEVLEEHATSIQLTLNEIKETVQKLVEMYTKTFRVNFSFDKPGLMEQTGNELIHFILMTRHFKNANVPSLDQIFLCFNMVCFSSQRNNRDF